MVWDIYENAIPPIVAKNPIARVPFPFSGKQPGSTHRTDNRFATTDRGFLPSSVDPDFQAIDADFRKFPGRKRALGRCASVAGRETHPSNSWRDAGIADDWFLVTPCGLNFSR